MSAEAYAPTSGLTGYELTADGRYRVAARRLSTPPTSRTNLDKGMIETDILGGYFMRRLGGQLEKGIKGPAAVDSLVEFYWPVERERLIELGQSALAGAKAKLGGSNRARLEKLALAIGLGGIDAVRVKVDLETIMENLPASTETELSERAAILSRMEDGVWALEPDESKLWEFSLLEMERWQMEAILRLSPRQVKDRFTSLYTKCGVKGAKPGLSPKEDELRQIGMEKLKTYLETLT